MRAREKQSCRPVAHTDNAARCPETDESGRELPAVPHSHNGPLAILSDGRHAAGARQNPAAPIVVAPARDRARGRLVGALLEALRQPVQALVQALAVGRACCLNVPVQMERSTATPHDAACREAVQRVGNVGNKGDLERCCQQAIGDRVLRMRCVSLLLDMYRNLSLTSCTTTNSRRRKDHGGSSNKHKQTLPPGKGSNG